ncbi:MAG: transaldolase [Chloroflexi bacterium]|nr:transaldolase [Chloroflexota bacterium]
MNTAKLLELGQSPWLDNIERHHTRSGELNRMVEQEGLRGLTSNPSIFDKSISKGQGYEPDIRRLAGQGMTAIELYESLTTTDIREAAQVLLPVHETSAGRDGYVSLEPPSQYAYDIEKTIAEASRLFRLVNAPNLMMKVPGTADGLVALRRLVGSGINVNVTLLFSPHNYALAAQAYIDGLSDLMAQGGDLTRIASVASVFVSRVDTLVDKQLEQRAAAETNLVRRHETERLRGRAALANCELIYHIYRQRFSAPDFQALAASGARPQRLLWGSTSTKNPAYSDLKYVEGLVAQGTINTLPLETWKALLDHGAIRYSLGYDQDGARATLDRIEDLGINMDEAHATLQREGVAAFDRALDSLLCNLEEKRKQAVVR